MASTVKQNESNLFNLIDKLIIYEKERGVQFDKRGFPIFEEDDFLKELCEEMLPYTHRNKSRGKTKTVICFFEPDKLLYRKLTFEKLISVSEELKLYQGFVGFDLSIFRDYLYPFQKFFILANLVITKFLTLSGNKCYPNLRTDETDGKSYFYLFEKAPIVCCGTLGCSKFKEQRKSNELLIDDYCDNHPYQILIQYGPNLTDKNNSRYFKAFRRKEIDQ